MGGRRFRPGTTSGEATFPVATYARDDGNCAITGGFVYRGPAAPSLVGAYLYGDYCSGRLWALTGEDGKWRVNDLADSDHRVSSFGEDEAGHVYVVDHAGAVLRVVDGA